MQNKAKQRVCLMPMSSTGCCNPHSERLTRRIKVQTTKSATMPTDCRRWGFIFCHVVVTEISDPPTQSVGLGNPRFESRVLNLFRISNFGLNFPTYPRGLAAAKL